MINKSVVKSNLGQSQNKSILKSDAEEFSNEGSIKFDNGESAMAEFKSEFDHPLGKMFSGNIPDMAGILS